MTVKRSLFEAHTCRIMKLRDCDLRCSRLDLLVALKRYRAENLDTSFATQTCPTLANALYSIRFN